MAATDHYALTDSTMPPDVAAYRQVLRDLPNTQGWTPQLEWDDLRDVVVLGVPW